jgi:hypothetical protein
MTPAEVPNYHTVLVSQILRRMTRHSLSLLLVLLVVVSAKGGHHGKRGGCAKQCRKASHSWNKCKGLVAEGVCSYLQTVQGGVLQCLGSIVKIGIQYPHPKRSFLLSKSRRSEKNN